MVDDQAAKPSGESPREPYGSAGDLPSVVELRRQLLQLTPLARLLGKSRQIGETQAELDRLVTTVDDFYELLGERNWIFHDALPHSKIEDEVLTAPSPAEAEQRLIAIYRDEHRTKWWLVHLWRLEGFRMRETQIKRAREHYFADQFDSCAMQLIAVMDGFVNDWDPEARRGLHAREPDEMVAWDSVAGHHRGLSHAMTTFRRSFSRRRDDEVFDLYRHGIMHGVVANFDNVVVASKAWGMLFAIRDWAAASARAARPNPDEPTWSAVMAQRRHTKVVHEALRDFTPTTHDQSAGSGFADHYIVQRSAAVMDSWIDANYGALVAFETDRRERGLSRNRRAGKIRDRFNRYRLDSYTLVHAEHEALGKWVVTGTAQINGVDGVDFVLHWSPEDLSAETEFGTGTDWRIMFVRPVSLLEDIPREVYINDPTRG